MNHREFIVKTVSADVVDDQCRCKEIQLVFVSECLKDYDKSTYHDIDHLVSETKKKILLYKPMVRSITATQYAEKAGICVSTARWRLKKMLHVNCDGRKKPYIYSLT